MTAAVVATTIGVLLLAGLASATSSSSPNSATVVDGHPSERATLPTKIQHVFVIVMENEGVDQIYGVEPYETQLANTYAWGGDAVTNVDGTGYYAVCHPSAPNYLALTSGQPLQCGSDSYSAYSANNIGNLLDNANESWTAWEESAKFACQDNTHGLYAVKHMAFPYYTDLGGDTKGSACEQHVLPIANLTADFPYNATPPAYTYIAPNLLNDGHNTNATYADNWLRGFVPTLMNQSWFSSSVIFIVYDESYGANSNGGYDGLTGGPVYMAAVSPFTKGVGALTTNSSHYNVLSTCEWLLGLNGTGSGNDSTVAFPALKALFTNSVYLSGSDHMHSEVSAASTSIAVPRPARAGGF